MRDRPPSPDKAENDGKAWFVYVLRCADDSLYTGVTTDVERRCAEHSAGNGARYTRGRLPVQLMFTERHESRSSALRRELDIKSRPRAAKEAIIQRGAGGG